MQLLVVLFVLNSYFVVSMLRLAIGSKNPVKIQSVKNGVTRILRSPVDDAVVAHGFDVPSGVAAQPMGDEETLQGALNRAKAAYDAFVSEYSSRPDFAVGLEGGVKKSMLSDDLECFAWIAVYDGTTYGRASTATFQLPQVISDLILKQGMELGAADDLIFKRSNSKQQNGSVGLLTKGVIDRTAYYEHAVTLAFVPFISNELYGTRQTILTAAIPDNEDGA